VSEGKHIAFEVLNYRGRNLSEGDLLRSTTMERLERADSRQEQADKIRDEILAVKTGHIDHFLRVYYASDAGKRAGPKPFDDCVREFFPDTLSIAKF